MSEAKEEILNRIKSALKEVPEEEQPGDIPVSRTYNQKGNRSKMQRVELFIERAGEYKANVIRVKEGNLKEAIFEACIRQNAKEVVIPEGFKKEWLPDDLRPKFDSIDTPLNHQELDQSDGVISTCALAIAQTGTIILDTGPGQGRRVLSLLPDYHLCIVQEAQIVELVPEGFSRIESEVKNEGRPITLISGPSATSDIELSRVEGVHGPRRLDILVVG